MEAYLSNAGEKALDMARANQVEAEAFLLHDRELSIEVANGQVETLKQAEEVGLGLRVINQGRLGFAYTCDLSDSAIKQLAADAVTISRYTAADQFNVLPQANFTYPHLQIFDNTIASTSLENKIDLARQAEETAKHTDKRIKVVERSGYEDSDITMLVMNTNGVYAYSQANFTGLYIFVAAEEDNDAQNGFSMMIKKHIKDIDPEFIGREAAEKAVRSLHARLIKSAQLPCVLDPYVVTRFLSIIAQTVGADAVQKGKSMFAGKEGEMVASACFSLVDDAIREDGIASFPFDSEGVAARKTMVIEQGILKSFLFDSYTAARAGIVSTGSGQRGSFRTLPSVGSANFILMPGQRGPEELIGDIDRGLYITEVMGMHTANPISGDFSVGASGIMIEKGSMTFPVRGITIAGNIMDFLKDVDDVASNLRFYGGKAAPAIRVKSLSIGGE